MLALVPLLAAAALLLPLGVSTAEGAGRASCSAADADPGKVASGAVREAIVCLLNKQRRKRGLSALQRSRKLQRAAQNHNERMVHASCFAHECPGEPALAQRIEAVGYLVGLLRRWAVGENIAWALGDRAKPRRIVDAWMHSPPHKAVILERDFREVGIGVTRGTPLGHEAGATFTADFGLRSG